VAKSALTALRGSLVSFVDDPFLTGAEDAFVYEPDGLVICRDGKIESAGAYDALRNAVPEGTEIADHSGCLITPGFIDTHVHYVQTEIIAAPGLQLLGWLSEYVFPAEEAFADEAHAQKIASIFCDRLLSNGTTTALVYCASYPQSVDALFIEAEKRNMRLLAGKCMMDRNAPDALLDTAKGSYDESKALLVKWQGRGRLHYAITPRWAGGSTPEQLELAGALWREHPDAHLQTHIAENRDEIAFVMKLFPARKDYLDIYAHYGLVGPRAVLGHGIYLGESELCRCHEADAAIAHCPTSNLFLGSGLFALRKAKDVKRPVHVGLGTDIGAGTSFSALATLNEAYKVSQLVNAPIGALQGFYLATLGGARALHLDDRIGSLRPGIDADLAIIDPKATDLLAFRTARAQSIEDVLFVLMTLGDDRAVRATYIAGECAHRRKSLAADS
jgi:guanine deaminase